MNFNKLYKTVASGTQTGTGITTETRTRGHHNPKYADLDANGTHAVIEASHVGQRFTSEKGGETTVLDDISFNLHEGEIVAILGRSGAGKSTFLRILAGLIQPTSGQVSYRGKALNGPNPGVALVFQTFALMPWLTVEDNVELGLEARGVPREERHKRALAAIDAIGLDGFESAYPKELSGGMKQRIGIARALVLRPDALFMDEPFSALDVLTAENLRQEVLKLWNSNRSGIKSILIVTHNIEEAVQMADRVVVLGSHPGHLIAQVPVNLPRPRDKHSPEFEAMVDKLYTILTGQESQRSRANAVNDNAENTEAGTAVKSGTTEKSSSDGYGYDTTDSGHVKGSQEAKRSDNLTQGDGTAQTGGANDTDVQTSALGRHSTTTKRDGDNATNGYDTIAPAPDVDGSHGQANKHDHAGGLSQHDTSSGNGKNGNANANGTDDSGSMSSDSRTDRNRHDDSNDADNAQAKANAKLTAHENVVKTKKNGAPDELLPNATPGGLAGLLDVVSNYEGGVDLADLAADLSFEVDDLFPLIDAGTMLGLLTVSRGHCTVTRDGDRWCHADVLEAKKLFAQLIMDHAPLVRTIDWALRNHPDKGLRGELILDLLRSQHTDEEAQQQFDIAVTWGRYGELFDYDADDDQLTLDDANR
ncbi:nitrate/sulfonate/bicarbonate ABC transporter ATP-binding protein [Bifidobacterium sp. ESL0800]|uniref:ABC transporter ATP-binding protein n=1 Tax=Bifidobacterium sp. ESL0800 TaxID=2983236 RepID=UPI0023F66A4D|nr:nitrate/sulfonate/bicarbonate ABC transporter ATP-binding protein [Bifidobacterium sp. ESL0800]WEV75120.1 nitrate/sulfonate/bicarbonate ABC transporter ATP-binding protein [Bifidobacterium sp. ESL0800]